MSTIHSYNLAPKQLPQKMTGQIKKKFNKDFDDLNNN